jgi:hypothetical protein
MAATASESRSLRPSDTVVVHMARLAGLDRDETPVVLVAEGGGFVARPRARPRFDYFGASIVILSVCPAAAMRWS